MIIPVIIILYISVGVIMFLHEKKEKRIKHLSVSVESVVEDVLEWSSKNFPSESIHKMSVELVYLPARFKVMGNYDPQNCLITLYVFPNLEVRELVDTILHEYFHHIDLSNQNVQPLDSGIFSKSLFRYYHPVERRARKFACRNSKTCFQVHKKKWL